MLHLRQRIQTCNAGIEHRVYQVQVCRDQGLKIREE